MKRFNETQKKWALTASLATVLSFNLIMGLTGTTYGSMSLAATAPDDAAPEVLIEGELAEPRFEPLVTDKNKYKIKYVKQEDGTTKAYVPKIVEGKYCWEDCGKEYFLPTNFEASREDLEQALRKALKKDAVKAELLANDEAEEDDSEAVVEKKAKKLKKGKKQKEEVEENEDLVALKEECAEEEEDYILGCYSEGLQTLLTDKKKNLPQEEVLALYEDEVEPLMIEALSDPNNRERRKEAHQHLGDMLSSVLKKYNYLRERMVHLSALTVIQAQQEAQALFKKGDSVRGMRRRAIAEGINFDLRSTLNTGLVKAQYDKFISDAHAEELYTNKYLDVVDPIIKGMQQNPASYVITTPMLEGDLYMYDGNGSLIQLGTTQNTVSNMRNLGRGVTTLNNGLTQVNVLSTNAPRIVTVNGMNNAPGTATIQVIQANQIPQHSAPVAAPGTNVIGIRGR